MGCLSLAPAQAAPASSPSPPAPPQALESDEAALCRRSCERDLECKAKVQGVAAPEGQGREGLLKLCTRTCEFMVNDFTRPQLRACLEIEDCAEFERCLSPDADEPEMGAEPDEGGGF